MIKIESYGYTMADLIYDWKEGPSSVQVLYYTVLHCTVQV